MTLDAKTLAELKNALLSKKGDFENELGRFAKPTENPEDFKTQFQEIGTDMDENASEIEEYSDNLALENNLEKQLRETNDALEKIEKGTYGICENCGQEIDIERLRAYPAAKTCVKCK